MKRTYKVTEIANKIGKTRATVMEWSNQFREFLPIVTTGGALKYSEEAIDMFQFISRMKEANKSIKLIKEDLQEMREKAVTLLNQETKPEPPSPPSVPDSPEPEPEQEPLAANNSNSELSKEPMNLRQMVQHLKQKTEANKTRDKVKASMDDRNQKVGISSVSGVRALSPAKVGEDSEKDLKAEILEFVSGLLSQQYRAVSEDAKELRKRDNARSEEITQLSNICQVLDRKVAELFQQDITSEVITSIELLNQQYENAMQGVQELRNVIQLQSNKAIEMLEQKLRCEMKAESESLLERYGAMSNEVSELRSSMVQIHNNELEQEFKSNMTKREEVLNKKYDAILLQLTSQQQVLERIAKFLGFQVTK